MVLPDTSVWINFVQRRNNFTWPGVFEGWLRKGEIATCGVVLAEFLPFLQRGAEREYSETVFESLTYLSPQSDLEFWKNIAVHQKSLSQKGIHRIGIADLIIIEISRAYNIAIVSDDQHFQMAKKVLSFGLIKPSEL